MLCVFAQFTVQSGQSMHRMIRLSCKSMQYAPYDSPILQHVPIMSMLFLHIGLFRQRRGLNPNDVIFIGSTI